MLIVLISTGSAFGQNVELDGRIEDQQTHKALPYATIELFNLKTGTIANDNGEFKLSIHPTNSEIDSLVFSCLGYEKSKMSLGNF